MSALSLALAVHSLVGRSSQGGIESIRAALSSEDYHGALELTKAEREPALLAREVAEIYYRAGDPARALQAAQEGLAADPRQLDSLYFATGSAIWLECASLAEETVNELERAVEREVRLTEPEKQQWGRVIVDFRIRTHELQSHELELERATRRSRLLAIGGVLVGLLLSILVGRRI